MKANLISLVLTLGLLTGAARAQTNAGNYYSWQHPEWPPSPGRPDMTLGVYRMEDTDTTNNFLFDDRGFNYPTNVSKKMESLRRDREEQELKAARFPEVRARYVRRRDAATNDVERANYVALLKRIDRRGITPYPYTIRERGEIEDVLVIGLIGSTNPAALWQGVHYTLPSGGNGFIRAYPKFYLEALPYAQAALVSTNRADVDAFYAHEPRMMHEKLMIELEANYKATNR